MSSYIRLLRRHPAYARLWVAQCVSLLGDWFSLIALSTLVSRYSNGSGLAVSGLLLSQLLPTVLIGPFAGVLVDRLDRKRLLIISDVLRTGITLLFLLATGPDRLWLIYLLTALQFTLSALFEPARSALTPSLVDEDSLVEANVLGSVTWSVMLAVGGLVGGAAAALLGPWIALGLNAASFAISALLISLIRVPSDAVTAHAQPTQEHVSQQGMIEGLRYIARHLSTASSLLIKSGGSIGSIDALMIIYATKLFIVGENGAASLGLLYASFGIGAVLGPLLLNRFHDNTVRKMRRAVTLAYACNVIGLFVFGTAPLLIVAMLGMLVRAMGGSGAWTYSSVIIQKTVPNRFLGRMFSIDLAATQLCSVISAVVTGWIVDRAGSGSVRSVVLGTSGVAIGVVILWLVVLPWIERGDAHGDESTDQGVSLVVPASVEEV